LLVGEEYEGRKFETVFRSRELPEDSRVMEIIDWGARLHRLGLLPHASGGFAGNMSFRNSNGFVITSGGVDKGKLLPNDFVQVLSCSPESMKVTAEGEMEPSSETFMHYMIYEKRKDVNAIIHVHDKEVARKASKLKVKSTRHKQPYGTPELAREVEKAAGHEKFLVIKDHGVVSFGKSVWEAAKMAVTMHEAAENA
jgi:ribulose-5-phosphate 4-epimerase/fuculose-1-phosphate aldolase